MCLGVIRHYKQTRKSKCVDMDIKDFKSLKDERQKAEKELIKSNKDTPYPNYETLKTEGEESKDELMFTIKDADGKVVKKEFRPAKKGVQRLHWNLRYTLQNPISLRQPTFYNPFGGRDEGKWTYLKMEM